MNECIDCGAETDGEIMCPECLEPETAEAFGWDGEDTGFEFQLALE